MSDVLQRNTCILGRERGGYWNRLTLSKLVQTMPTLRFKFLFPNGDLCVFCDVWRPQVGDGSPCVRCCTNTLNSPTRRSYSVSKEDQGEAGG